MSAYRIACWGGALALLALTATAAPAAPPTKLGPGAQAAKTPQAQPQPAQESSGGLFSGMQQNRDQPVKIESATLEVRDKENKATFTGNVQVTQGDTILRCKRLVVFYDQAPNAAPAQPGQNAPAQAGQKKSSGQSIKRAEAEGDVVVIQKDQTATGDRGIFDMKSNTMTLTGNVVLTQCQNVVRGESLFIDLTTGMSRVEAGKGARVSSLLVPNGNSNNQQAQNQPGCASGGAAEPPVVGSGKDTKPPAAPKR